MGKFYNNIKTMIQKYPLTIQINSNPHQFISKSTQRNKFKIIQVSLVVNDYSLCLRGLELNPMLPSTIRL